VPCTPESANSISSSPIARSVSPTSTPDGQVQVRHRRRNAELSVGLEGPGAERAYPSSNESVQLHSDEHQREHGRAGERRPVAKGCGDPVHKHRDQRGETTPKHCLVQEQTIQSLRNREVDPQHGLLYGERVASSRRQYQPSRSECHASSVLRARSERLRDLRFIKSCMPKIMPGSTNVWDNIVRSRNRLKSSLRASALGMNERRGLSSVGRPRLP